MDKAREIIADALFEFSGSGQGVDDMLAAIAEAQSDVILSALSAAGYRVVGPGEVDGAGCIATDKMMLSCDEDGWSYAIRHGELFEPGSFDFVSQPHEAILEIAAALSKPQESET